MSAHTPAPWVVSDLYADDEGNPELAILAKVNGKDCYPAAVCLQFPTMQGMQMANARLIASAPDLLAKLQFVLRGLDSGSIKSKPIIDFSDESAAQIEFQSLASILRAVIAKATGGPA